MKNIKKLLIYILTFVVSVVGSGFILNNKKQVATAISTQEQIYTNVISELTGFISSSGTARQRTARFPGSVAELNSALYINSVMQTLSNFEPVNDSSTVNGVQRFEFISNIDQMTKTSQNIIYRKQTQTVSKKKIIIATHYDMMPIAKNSIQILGETVTYYDTSGINESGLSVAMLLSLAKMLDDKEDLGFSVEIVFFGANNNNYAGSEWYTRGISAQEAGNILLMLNIDKIGLGEYNYFYMNEYENSQSNYVSNLLKYNQNFRNLKLENVMHFSEKSPNGLDYTHIGLEADHAVFLNQNINVINFFSGSYEELITIGRSEYSGVANITYTENDELAYILATYDNFENNIVNIYEAIEKLVSANDFVSEMEKDNHAKSFYGTYKNQKLAVVITVLLFVVMLFVFNIIYTSLKKKSKKSLSKSGVSQISIKIIKNIGEEDNSDLNEFIDKKVKDDTEDKD